MYKKLLNIDPTLADLEEMKPEVGKSMRLMLEMGNNRENNKKNIKFNDIENEDDDNNE